jgi:hypothetical protein
MPFDELINRVAVTTLSVARAQAIENRRFPLVEIRQTQDGLGAGVSWWSVCLPSSAVLLDRQTIMQQFEVVDG